VAKRIPSRENPIEHYVRREQAERRVGVDAQCSTCGESRAEALIVDSTPITCVKCHRTRKGHRTVDLHHVAGEANDATIIPVVVNDHVADLSERQRDWPHETLENPHGCPLLRAAACIRGAVDVLYYTVERSVTWIAKALESLSAWLSARFGPSWFHGTPLEQFAPAGKGR
jgi:hypothetical protein